MLRQYKTLFGGYTARMSVFCYISTSLYLNASARFSQNPHKLATSAVLVIMQELGHRWSFFYSNVDQTVMYKHGHSKHGQMVKELALTEEKRSLQKIHP